VEVCGADGRISFGGGGHPRATAGLRLDFALVNEKLPPWNQILTAHDVARLTRRHRWVLSALALLGRFPRQYRFQGRGIGWRQCDVCRWLESERHLESEAVPFKEFSPLQWQLEFARRCSRRSRHSPPCTRSRGRPTPEGVPDVPQR